MKSLEMIMKAEKVLYNIYTYVRASTFYSHSSWALVVIALVLLSAGHAAWWRFWTCGLTSIGWRRSIIRRPRVFVLSPSVYKCDFEHGLLEVSTFLYPAA